jgi:hypothetical protein
LALPAVVVTTSDSIPIRIQVRPTIAPADDPILLKRLIADVSGQEGQAADAIIACLQEIFSTEAYEAAITSLPRISASVVARARDRLQAVVIAFRLHDILIAELQAEDQELASAALEKAKSARRARDELAGLNHQRELLRIRAELEHQEAENRNKLKRAQAESDATIAKAETLSSIERRKLELQVTREMALIAKDPEGRTVLFPKEAFNVEVERIRNESRIDKELLRYAVYGAAVLKEQEVLRAIIRRQGYIIEQPTEPPIAIESNEDPSTSPDADDHRKAT